MLRFLGVPKSIMGALSSFWVFLKGVGVWLWGSIVVEVDGFDPLQHRWRSSKALLLVLWVLVFLVGA